MAKLMRKCTQCGTVDTRGSWSSPAEAAKDGAFNRPWACSSCAWTEFELVEAEADTTDRPTSSVTR